MQHSYRSELKTFTTPTVAAPWDVPMDFLSRALKSQRAKMREVLSHLIVKVAIQVDTGGGVTAYGAQFWNALKQLRIYDAAQDLWNVKGAHLRLLGYADRGIFAARHNVADIAESQSNATRTLYMLVDFCPDRARRRWDFGVPVANLEGIEITCPAPADMAFSGGNPTIDSIAYQILAYTYDQDLEGGVEIPTRREVRYTQTTATTEWYVPCNNRILRAAYAFKPADANAGGASIATTHLECEALGLATTPVAVVHEQYLREANNHMVVSTELDPFLAYTAIPLVWPMRDQKIPMMLRHPGKLMYRITGETETSIDILTDQLTGRSDESQSGDLGAIRGPSELRVKTAGKTDRDAARWSQAGLLGFMPVKAVRR